MFTHRQGVSICTGTPATENMLQYIDILAVSSVFNIIFVLPFSRI